MATDPAEIPKLHELRDRAIANGVDPTALELLDGACVRTLEPGVHAVAALHSRVTGIVDVHSYMDALATDVEQEGGDLVLCAELLGASLTGSGWQVRVRDASGMVEELGAAVIVNAAGLYSDEVAGLAEPLAASELPSQQWVKGNYFSIRAGSAVRASRLIYPCPRPDLRGLGVHLTLDLAGGQRLGPDVEVLEQRDQAYAVSEDRRDGFVEGARRFLPDLRPEDLSPAFAGLRPQRVVDGGFRDFYITHEAERGAPGWVNLIGIESPGLTCSLAIGREVADLLE